MLRWSIRLFRVRGIQLSVHFTLVLLLAYIAWEGWREAGPLGAALNAGTMVAFFTCVVLHELGHSFVARAFGVRVPRILLLPIGGMAEFDRIPRRPAHEILIALAGPAVNAVIVAGLLPFTSIPSRAELASLEVGPLQLLLLMNFMMGTFNLLPVFPMDGGRVLRAFLARKTSYLQATRWAATVGKVLALAGIVTMLFYFHHIMGGVLFLFILFAGEMEYRAVLRQEQEEKRWNRIFEQLRLVSTEPPPLNQ